jgi:hypothetical protein
LAKIFSASPSIFCFEVSAFCILICAVKQIFVIIAVGLFYCIGCTPPPEAPVWENVKYKDLARAKHAPQSVLEAPLQFNMYIFALPANNFSSVKDVWTTLSTKPIRFMSKDSFGENGFAAGIGKTTQWEPIAKELRAARSKNLKTTDLVMFPGDQEYVSLSKLDAEKNIFYRTQDNQISGATLGPGETLLRLTAVTLPDVRGVCKLTIEPMFKNAAKSPIAPADANDLAFTSATFSVRMSPGDFILFGPVNFSPQDMTLSSIFFSSPDPLTMQIYMIVCAGVSN